MFTDANKLECWPLSTGTLLLASFQNSTHQTKKAELQQFAKKISDECSLPEAGFSTDGIAQHIKSFFSEQRRFQKNRQKVHVLGLLLKLLYLTEELIMWLVGISKTLPNFTIIQWPTVIDFELVVVYIVEFVGSWNT